MSACLKAGAQSVAAVRYLTFRNKPDINEEQYYLNQKEDHMTREMYESLALVDLKAIAK